MPRPNGTDNPLRPAPRSPRYASLDLWRGVACLIVVLMHAISYAPWYQAIIGKTPLPGRMSYSAA